MIDMLQVVRFDSWTHPVFDQTLDAREDVRLVRCRFGDSPQQALQALASAHALHLSAAKDEVPTRWLVNADLLSRCPNLLCVSSSGAGYDTIDVDACTAAGVAVMNQAGGNAASVAEHTLGLMLAVAHRIVESDRELRSRRGFSREDLMGHEIGGKTVGLIGIGHIGARVAALARAFGMRVVATDPYVPPQEIERRGATPVGLDALLEQSDIVSLHCPRLPSTIGMIGADAFARMKRGAIFVSTARGGIHDETALADALRRGHLAGAGLDVWSVEPPALDHPLLANASVVATFHTAGVTHEARQNVAAMAASQILLTLDGGRPPRLVNPDVWPAYVARFEQMTGTRPRS